MIVFTLIRGLPPRTVLVLLALLLSRFLFPLSSSADELHSKVSVSFANGVLTNAGTSGGSALAIFAGPVL